jgi:hypothetical protein
MAARAGCVLTHTILIPQEAWGAFKNVRLIDRYFRNPRLYPEYQFTDSIELDAQNVPDSSFSDVKVDTAASRIFVTRYFGQGIRPIVWFNVEKPDEYFWRLTEHLWPRLRTAFSCCTCSLQPRLLQDRPFDLLFAPAGVYSRFTKLTPDHLIDASKGRRTLSNEAEPWCEYWADALFSDQADLPSGENELPLWNELGEDPSSARKMSLVHELRLRASQSPTAGVGAIDVVESLAREASSAIPLKSMVFASAIEAASSATNIEDGLTTLRLVEDRLDREAFGEVSNRFHNEVQHAASRLAGRAPMVAIQASEAFTSNPVEESSSFQTGILFGLSEVAKRNPSFLKGMEEYPSTAVRLLNLEPSLAARYLCGAGHSGPSLVASWLTSTKDVNILREVRKAILPVLVGDEPEDLISALLRDMTQSEVPGTLDQLFRASNGFAAQSVLKVVIDRFSSVYSAEVRQWATQAKLRWTDGVAEVLAATFSDSPAGYGDFLSEAGFTGAQRAQILAKMLESHGKSSIPYWLRKMLSENGTFVEILASVPLAVSEQIDHALYRILDEVEEIVLTKSVTEDLQKFEGRPVFPLLVDKVMRALVVGYVTGENEQLQAAVIGESEAADRWVRNISSGHLGGLLLRGRAAGPEGVERAWKWISGGSHVLYERQDMILADLLDALIPHTKQSFQQNIETAIASILRRAKSESAPEVRQALAAKCLRYAFDNTRLALSAVVAESFADVYSQLTQSDRRRVSFFEVLFLSYDWDKGKDLRIALVDAFLRSDWRPGDLAVAAERAGILGKIFKRVRRRSHGDEYIAAMERDLSLRATSEAASVRERLASMVSKPDFYEEWD